MAASPRFKVYTPENEYIGCVKHAEDAAALVALRGDGGTVRDGHRKADVVWTEGIDGCAGDSVDAAAETIHERIAERAAALQRTRARVLQVSEPVSDYCEPCDIIIHPGESCICGGVDWR